MDVLATIDTPNGLVHITRAHLVALSDPNHTPTIDEACEHVRKHGLPQVHEQATPPDAA